MSGCRLYTISPAHSNQSFIDLAVRLEEMGADSICIKDMAGLLTPYVAYDLVKGIKANVKIPLQLHTLYQRSRINDLYYGHRKQVSMLLTVPFRLCHGTYSRRPSLLLRR